MKKESLAVIGMVMAALAWSPVAAQQGLVGVVSSEPCSDGVSASGHLGAPFGSFEGHGRTGGNAASDQFPLRGWALDDDGVARVDILVDGNAVGGATYGIARPDVAAVFPGFPDAAFSGWVFNLDTTRFTNGFHTVSAEVLSNTGEVSRLNSAVFEFNNVTHNLRPFGALDYPTADATLFGRCDLENPDRRYSVVEGWALDAGLETNDHGVGYVELLVDGAIWANSRLDCVFDPVLGEWTNCYGKPRFDVERQFPLLKDSASAGFRFVLDIGFMIAGVGYSEGQHALTVRVGDIDSQVSNVVTRNVIFRCDDGFENVGFGEVDPAPEGVSFGTVPFRGWALDRQRIGRIEIYVDGRFVGNARYGFQRPEVTSRFPGYFNSNAPGWVFSLDTTTLADGEHTLIAVAVDRSDGETVIGEISFRTLNP